MGLIDNGVRANGRYDLSFALYAGEADEAQMTVDSIGDLSDW